MRPLPDMPCDAHPGLPGLMWVVVQQPKAEPYRVAFDPQARAFHLTGEACHLHDHGFGGVYGWVGGLGEPPGEHLGAYVLTCADPRPGEVLEVSVHGMLRPAGGAPALLGIDAQHTPAHGAVDLGELPRSTRLLLERVGDDGRAATWLPGEIARRALTDLYLRQRARGRGHHGWPDPDTWEGRKRRDEAPWTW